MSTTGENRRSERDPAGRNPGSPDSLPIGEIRSRLKSLGYLESPVERYLSRRAGGPWTTGMMVTVKVSLLIGFLLAGLTTSSTLLADPALIGNWRDVFILLGYLLAFYSGGSLLLLLLPAVFLIMSKKSYPDIGSRGTLRSAILSMLTSALVCAYLLGWWHMHTAGTEQILPLGVLSLTVLTAIGLVSVMAGRLMSLVYFLLAGVPESGRGKHLPGVRSYLFSLLAVLMIEGAWAVGNFRTNQADHTLSAALENYNLRPLPVLLLSIDGLGSQTLMRMAESGKMPNLARLAGQGYTTGLRTGPNYLAPQVWNTVATGVKPEHHGITSFTRPALRGMSRPLHSLDKSGAMEMMIEYVFPFFRLVRPAPLHSSTRLSRTLWEIVELYGSSAGVINWWGTWPAPTARGFVVSERTFSRVALVYENQPIKPSAYFNREVYPAAEFDSLVTLRNEISDRFESFLFEYPVVSELLGSEISPRAGELIESVYFADFFYTHAAIELARRYDVDFLSLYLQGPDILSRLDERTDLVESGSLDPLIPEYYSYLDRLIGMLLGSYQPSGLAAVICDPGKKGRAGGSTGAAIFSGVDAIKSVRADSPASIEDVAPTMLYLMGLPVSRAMGGKVLTGAAQPGPAGPPPLHHVTSYGSPPPLAAEQLSSPGTPDRQEIERLRSLGYLK